MTTSENVSEARAADPAPVAWLIPVDTVRLRALLDKATTRPWERCSANGGGCECSLVWAPDEAHVVLPNVVDLADPESVETAFPLEQRLANTIAITEICNAGTDMLDEIERLRLVLQMIQTVARGHNKVRVAKGEPELPELENIAEIVQLTFDGAPL